MFDCVTVADVPSKPCKDCGRLLSLPDFWPNRTYRNGISNTCKECKLTIDRKWRASNPDKVAEQLQRANDRRRERARIAREIAGMAPREPRCTEDGRRCSGCQKRLAGECFQKGGLPDGLAAHCKQCTAINTKRWSARNPERARAYRRAWFAQNRYGLSLEQYETMLAQRGGSCAICNLSFSASRKTPHIDHDHATGRARGLLCSNCNQGLGNFGDDLERLASAAAYLRGGG